MLYYQQKRIPKIKFLAAARRIEPETSESPGNLYQYEGTVYHADEIHDPAHPHYLLTPYRGQEQPPQEGHHGPDQDPSVGYNSVPSSSSS